MCFFLKGMVEDDELGTNEKAYQPENIRTIREVREHTPVSAAIVSDKTSTLAGNYLRALAGYVDRANQ